MISDPKLKKHFRELYYLCDNFFNNTYEKRFILYIIEEICLISKYVESHYLFDDTLKAYLAELPEFSKDEIELVSRSKKEKLLSTLFFCLALPFSLVLIKYSTGVLEMLKDKTEYKDKRYENARNNVIGNVSIISGLTIEILGKFE